jgi:hypothetical protein
MANAGVVTALHPNVERRINSRSFSNSFANDRRCGFLSAVRQAAPFHAVPSPGPPPLLR